MKKSSVNTFKHGIISDLNPINMPNTALTDCLNGTMLTYDGNEYSLQNDKGNYPLKYCKLKPNYIPVGIKEYGGILYIISYNPLDNRTEIGSYPSPLMISEYSPEGQECEIHSAINNFLTKNQSKYIKISELESELQSYVFYGDDFKLNPGDQYCLIADEELKLNKYEDLKVSIIDDNSKLNPVNDINIQVNSSELIDNNYDYVKWPIPGWISIGLRLAEVGTAAINTRSFYLLKNKDKDEVHFSINFKLNIEDDLILKWFNEANQYKYDIGFRIEFLRIKDGQESSLTQLIDFNLIDDCEFDNEYLYLSAGNSESAEWYQNNKVVWRTIGGVIRDVEKSDVFKLKMTPILSEYVGSELKYTLIYDKLTEPITYDISEIDNIPWQIGRELYTFYTTQDKKNQRISFDISGPKIASKMVTAQYQIKDLNGNIVKPFTEISISGIGQNDITIPYDSMFKKEEIYIVTWQLIHKKECLDETNRILITSELFNDFSIGDYKHYDTIPSRIWLEKYTNHIITPGIINNIYDITNSNTIFTESVSKHLDSKHSDDIWFGTNYYSHFIPKSSNLYKNINEETVIRGNYYNCSCNVNSPEFLTSGLWKNFDLSVDTIVRDRFGKELTFVYGKSSGWSGSIPVNKVPVGLGLVLNIVRGDETLVGQYDSIDRATTNNATISWEYDDGSFDSLNLTFTFDSTRESFGREIPINFSIDHQKNITELWDMKEFSTWCKSNITADFIDTSIHILKTKQDGLLYGTNSGPHLTLNGAVVEGHYSRASDSDGKYVDYIFIKYFDSETGFSFAEIPYKSDVVVKVNAGTESKYELGNWVSNNIIEELDFSKLLINSEFIIKNKKSLQINLDIIKNIEHSECISDLTWNDIHISGNQVEVDSNQEFNFDQLIEVLDISNSKSLEGQVLQNKLTDKREGEYVKGIMINNQYNNIGNISENYRLTSKLYASKETDLNYYLGYRTQPPGSIGNFTHYTSIPLARKYEN